MLAQNERKLVKARLDARLYDELARLAREGDRPLAREVRRALRAHIAQHRKPEAPQ